MSQSPQVTLGKLLAIALWQAKWTPGYTQSHSSSEGAFCNEFLETLGERAASSPGNLLSEKSLIVGKQTERQKWSS